MSAIKKIRNKRAPRAKSSIAHKANGIRNYNSLQTIKSSSRPSTRKENFAGVKTIRDLSTSQNFMSTELKRYISNKKDV